jgi:basic membrane protein A
MTAAERTGKKVIMADVDHSEDSPAVLTSAMKGVPASIYSCISDFYAGSFPGGQAHIFSAANDGVCLPMETSRFSGFSQSDYNAIFRKLAAKEIPRMNNLAEDGSPGIVPVVISRVEVTQR